MCRAFVAALSLTTFCAEAQAPTDLRVALVSGNAADATTLTSAQPTPTARIRTPREQAGAHRQRRLSATWTCFCSPAYCGHA